MDDFDPLLLPEIRHQLLDVKTFLNPQIEKLLDDLGVYIFMIEAFSEWIPYSKTHIHIDAGGTDISKINWIFGGSDSSNQWYQIKSEKSGTASNTTANTGSTRFDINDVEKILYTHPAGPNPFIFQAAIPHKAVLGKERRCCISILPKWKSNNKRLTYSECTNLLQSYLVAGPGLEPRT